MNSSRFTELKQCPWRCFKVADSDWLVKGLFTDEFYEVIFSNQTNAWHERLSIEDVGQHCKETNPSMEIKSRSLLNHIQDGLFGNHEDAKFTLSNQRNSAITLVMSFRLAGLPFCWKFHASTVPLDLLRAHLTEPLLAMVCELSRQRRELYAMLRNKDKEIADLKAQGVAVTRKRLETPVFDESAFLHQASSLKKASDWLKGGCREVFNTEGQQLYSSVMKSVEQSQHELPVSAAAASGDNQTASSASSASNSPLKTSQHKRQSEETEEQRRAALAKRLAEEEKKQAAKKKKKIKF